MKKSRLYLWSAISGAMLALSFPPLPFGGFAFAAFLPLFRIFVVEKPAKGRFMLLYTAFFVYQVGANWWIGSFQADTDPFLLASAIGLALAHPFFFFVPFGAFFYIQRKYGENKALWLFPFIWTAFEWLHGLGDFSYPWLTIGYSQIYNNSWIQFVDLTGVWGASFLIALVNVIFFKLIQNKRNSPGTHFLKLLAQPESRNYVYALAVIFIVPIVYGLYRENDFEHEKLLKEKPVLKTALLQPAINPWRKWEKTAFEQIQIHAALQDSLVRAAGRQDLFIWCETAITFVGIEFNSAQNINYLYKFTDSGRSSFMSGFSLFKLYQPGEAMPKTVKYLFKDTTRPYSTFNSAIMLNPQGSDKPEPQFYCKSRLTPFAERIPYEEHFGFLKQFVEWGVGISSWEKGREQKPLICSNQRAKASIAPIICIESIYPGYCADFAAMGANLYTVITNDAWYDYTIGPEQHYQIAAMRAIETRRYLARCANTGVSGYITPLGTSLRKLPQYERIAATENLPLLDEKTIYVKFGDWLPQLSLIVTFVSILFLAIGNKRKVK